MHGLHTFVNILTLTCAAVGVIGAYKCVGFDDAQITADGNAVKGVSLNPATDGLDIALIALGTVTMIADEAIPVGSSVMASADGNIKVASDASVAFAKTITAAANPGDAVQILIR